MIKTKKEAQQHHQRNNNSMYKVEQNVAEALRCHFLSQLTEEKEQLSAQLASINVQTFSFNKTTIYSCGCFDDGHLDLDLVKGF